MYKHNPKPQVPALSRWVQSLPLIFQVAVFVLKRGNPNLLTRNRIMTRNRIELTAEL